MLKSQQIKAAASSCPVTNLPSYPATQLPSYPATQLPIYPVAQLSSYPAVRQLGNSLAIMTCKGIRAHGVAQDCITGQVGAQSSGLGCNPERVIPPLTCFHCPPGQKLISSPGVG